MIIFFASLLSLATIVVLIVYLFQPIVHNYKAAFLSYPWAPATIDSVSSEDLFYNHQLNIHYSFKVKGESYSREFSQEFEHIKIYQELNRYLDMQEQDINLIVRYNPSKPKDNFAEIELINTIFQE